LALFNEVEGRAQNTRKKAAGLKLWGLRTSFTGGWRFVGAPAFTAMINMPSGWLHLEHRAGQAHIRRADRRQPPSEWTDLGFLLLHELALIGERNVGYALSLEINEMVERGFARLVQRQVVRAGELPGLVDDILNLAKHIRDARGIVTRIRLLDL
jgi:hypothetical protein